MEPDQGATTMPTEMTTLALHPALGQCAGPISPQLRRLINAHVSLRGEPLLQREAAGGTTTAPASRKPPPPLQKSSSISFSPGIASAAAGPRIAPAAPRGPPPRRPQVPSAPPLTQTPPTPAPLQRPALEGTLSPVSASTTSLHMLMPSPRSRNASADASKDSSSAIAVGSSLAHHVATPSDGRVSPVELGLPATLRTSTSFLSPSLCALSGSVAESHTSSFCTLSAGAVNLEGSTRQSCLVPVIASSAKAPPRGRAARVGFTGGDPAPTTNGATAVCIIDPEGGGDPSPQRLKRANHSGNTVASLCDNSVRTQTYRSSTCASSRTRSAGITEEGVDGEEDEDDGASQHAESTPLATASDESDCSDDDDSISSFLSVDGHHNGDLAAADAKSSGDAATEQPVHRGVKREGRGADETSPASQPRAHLTAACTGLDNNQGGCTTPSRGTSSAASITSSSEKTATSTSILHLVSAASASTRSAAMSHDTNTNSLQSLLQPDVSYTSVVHKVKDSSGKRYINGYRIIKRIGVGSCGKVRLAWDGREHRHVAIKEVKRAERKRRLGGKTAAQQRFESALREIDVMTKLRHKNIVSVYNVIDDSNADSVYIVMQYVENGPIATIRVVEGTDQVCEPMPPQRLAAAARQMLAGLEYLHRKNVVHRDIKPDNILVDKDGRVYLADFGVAETFDTQHRERMERAMQESMAQSLAMSGTGGVLGSGPKVLGTKGTPLFIAPELYSGERSYGKPVDMWALGVTLFTLLTGRLPFRNPGEVTDPNLPVFPEAYGAEWAALLRGMLTQDPAARLTAAQARAMVKGIGHRESGGVPTAASVAHSPVAHPTPPPHIYGLQHRPRHHHVWSSPDSLSLGDASPVTERRSPTQDATEEEHGGRRFLRARVLASNQLGPENGPAAPIRGDMPTLSLPLPTCTDRHDSDTNGRRGERSVPLADLSHGHDSGLLSLLSATVNSGNSNNNNFDTTMVYESTTQRRAGDATVPVPPVTSRLGRNPRPRTCFIASGRHTSPQEGEESPLDDWGTAKVEGDV